MQVLVAVVIGIGIGVWFPNTGAALKPLGGGVKVTEARRHAGDRHLASGDLCHEGAPLGQGSRAPLLVDLPRDEMALLIELVVDLGVN